MKIEDAIKNLQRIKQDKQQNEELSQQKTFATSLMGLKNILVSTMVDLTKLVLSNEPKVTVKNFPRPIEKVKAEITNFPKDTTADEVKRLTEMMDKHHQEMKEEKEHKKSEKPDDFKQNMLMKGESIRGAIVSSSTGQMVKLANLQETLSQAVKAIKDIKLDPKIEVKSPKIEIPAPVVNVPATKFPEFPKKMEISNLDFSEIVARLEEVVTELQYNAKQSVTVANPGDFPVSFPIPSFRDINGATTQVTLTADGLLPVSIDGDNPLAKYRISDRDNAAFPKYYGSVDETGAWYILKEEANSFRYASGSSNYPTNWTNRASLTYSYYNDIF